MKKFEFSLERIREYKDSILRKEKNVLAGLRMEKSNIEIRIENLDKTFADINEEMNGKFATGLNVSEVRLYSYKMNGIRDEKRALFDRIDFLDTAIDRQMKRVVNLDREVNGYDKLEEKQREEYNKALGKEQELVISEFVSQKLTRELHTNA